MDLTICPMLFDGTLSRLEKKRRFDHNDAVAAHGAPEPETKPVSFALSHCRGIDQAAGLCRAATGSFVSHPYAFEAWRECQSLFGMDKTGSNPDPLAPSRRPPTP